MDSSVVPAKRRADEDAIRCICGLDYDDGFSIACDNCSRWCHAACFGIVDADVPEEWKCWICQPRPVDREGAERLQRTRISRIRDVDKHRRRLSPGIERKQRRPSTISEPQKRRRRPSITTTTPTQEDDTHIDIDEPSTHAYVPIAADIVHPDAREKLRRHAQNWRGVAAISTDDPTTPICLSDSQLTPTTTLRQIPPAALAHPFTNPDVRPPAYAVHTASPVPSHHFIAPFTSSITPSSSYLADPLNAYAHLGMPKPFVHLIGPPLDLALDARIAGDSSRFVRSGCKPNAVLRPVLCPPKGSTSTTDSLSFGVFALRDLKANEEVVLGWEWDDGNAVHSLPALIQTPQTFTHPSPSDSPHQIQRLRHQMSNILHALSSTFTTCACGAKARDCVINQMSAFVDGHSLYSPDHLDLGPLIGKRRGFRTREKLPFSSGLGGVEMCSDEEQHIHRDKKGKQRVEPNSFVHDDYVIAARSTFPSPTPDTFIAPPRMQRTVSHSSSDNNNSPLPEPDPPDGYDTRPLTEDRMPPKMRKRWNQQLRQQRKEISQSPAASIISLGSLESGGGSVALGIHMDNHQNMPPPPLPSTPSDLSHLTSFERSAVSPSSPFQPWAPFERKEASTKDSSEKMDVDEPVPIQNDASPSPHSPPISLSPRSHSRSRSRSPRPRSSPTSTAITTPPSPREPKLPDVVPIQGSPESPPPHIDIDSPSPKMSLAETDDTMKVDGGRPRTPPSSEAPVPEPTPDSPQQLSSPLSSPPHAFSEPDQDVPTPRKLTPPRTPTPPRQSTPPPRELTPPVTPTPTLAQILAPATTPSSSTPTSPSIPASAAPTITLSPSPPSPAPQPSKVKLSLKDFAARKKRLREVKGVGSVSTGADASPMVDGTKSLQASPNPGSDPLPQVVAMISTVASAEGTPKENAESTSQQSFPWWIRAPLLSVVGTGSKDAGFSTQTAMATPNTVGDTPMNVRVDAKPDLLQLIPRAQLRPKSPEPLTPTPTGTSLPLKLRSEMRSETRPTTTTSVEYSFITLEQREKELAQIQQKRWALAQEKYEKKAREKEEERQRMARLVSATDGQALRTSSSLGSMKLPTQEEGEIPFKSTAPAPPTPLPSSISSSALSVISTLAPAAPITPIPAFVPIHIPPFAAPVPTSIPTAPRAHRERRFNNTPTGPRWFQGKPIEAPKEPAALRDYMNLTRRPTVVYPPPPNTSPPPQPPPPPRTPLSPSPSTSVPASLQLGSSSISLSQFPTSLVTPLGSTSLSQKSIPQAPRAFPRHTNGNANMASDSHVSSPSSRASPTPSNASTTPSTSTFHPPPPLLPPISTKSHTRTKSNSTPTTPTATPTPTTVPSTSTMTLPNPSVAGLPSRPPAPVGLGLGHHLSSSHPMSMLGTSMAMGGVPKRSAAERNRYTRRVSEDRDRDRDREWDRDRDRDLERDRDRDWDRGRDRERDTRNRDGDRERDRDYRDRVWPRRPSPSSRQDWDSWDR